MSTTNEQQISIHLSLQGKFHRKELFPKRSPMWPGILSIGISLSSQCLTSDRGRCLTSLLSMSSQSFWSTMFNWTWSISTQSLSARWIVFPWRSTWSSEFCLCTKECSGSRCQMKWPSIQMPLSVGVPSKGLVIQYFQIDLVSLDLSLLDQQAFRNSSWTRGIFPYYSSNNFARDRLSQSLFFERRPDISRSSSSFCSSECFLLSAEKHKSLRSIDANIFEISPKVIPKLRMSMFPHMIWSLSLFLSLNSESSLIRYHHHCRKNADLLCFRDDVYLCICMENHTRVECFRYDDQLDRCPYCLPNGRCLQGDRRQSNDFVCLCTLCYFGEQCQFNTKSFSFTLDQLFSPDLFFNQRQMTISLLIFFSPFPFVWALPTNLSSLITFRRRRCLRQVTGHYLLWMSVVNQLNLAFFVARLIHLIVKSSESSPPSI